MHNIKDSHFYGKLHTISILSPNVLKLSILVKDIKGYHLHGTYMAVKSFYEYEECYILTYKE